MLCSTAQPRLSLGEAAWQSCSKTPAYLQTPAPRPPGLALPIILPPSHLPLPRSTLTGMGLLESGGYLQTRR